MASLFNQPADETELPTPDSAADGEFLILCTLF